MRETENMILKERVRKRERVSKRENKRLNEQIPHRPGGIKNTYTRYKEKERERKER